MAERRHLRSVTIIGTGLIGASVGLALRAADPALAVGGFDTSAAEREAAFAAGAIGDVLATEAAAREHARAADVVVLATPVLAILHWQERLLDVLDARQMVTDVGSTKRTIAETAERLGYNAQGRPAFLPGHPMAGKERGGAALAEAGLFTGAMWLFTPVADAAARSAAHPLEAVWRERVAGFGARSRDLTPAQHDELLAWVSHLPQFLSTAFAALLESRFGNDPETAGQIAAIGARALRETTRLGASPFSMWRDVAWTNTDAVARTLQALEGELAHMRENLRTPELREMFGQANRFRGREDKTSGLSS